MKAVVITSNELFDPVENPTLCLSTTMVFNKCHLCDVYKRAFRRGEEEKLECNPHIPGEMLEGLKTKRRLQNELKKVNTKLGYGRLREAN